ncbi:MAG: DUF3427 domain-containing protein [Spirochaetales bacterium]|nr:DUF3427 domain-containing protein [Spirochaetales bacterium]
MKYLRQEYFDFKKIIGRIPHLVDFLKVDGAVDPMKFSTHSGTWLEFVSRVEDSEELATLCSHQDLLPVLRFFTDLTPLRRAYEAVIAKKALEAGQVSLSEARDELSKYLAIPHLPTIDYAFDFLSGRFFDSSEKTKYQDRLFIRQGQQLLLAPKLSQLCRIESLLAPLLDLLNYGILSYQLEFEDADYGVPHFKLWENYTMRDVALMCNTLRTHSSFRGQGLITTDKDFFMFVDLHKEADVKESINYQDKFEGPRHFQWESPNTTSPQSGTGQKLIQHEKQGISMHLFARKFREIENIAQPFTYFGKVIYRHHDPERSKPMRISYLLENEVPADLFYELTTKV